MVMIMNKTQSSAVFGIIAFIIGAMFLNTLPSEAHVIAIILMALAFIAVLFRALHKEGY